MHHIHQRWACQCSIRHMLLPASHATFCKPCGLAGGSSTRRFGPLKTDYGQYENVAWHLVVATNIYGAGKAQAKLSCATSFASAACAPRPRSTMPRLLLGPGAGGRSCRSSAHHRTVLDLADTAGPNMLPFRTRKPFLAD